MYQGTARALNGTYFSDKQQEKNMTGHAMSCIILLTQHGCLIVTSTCEHESCPHKDLACVLKAAPRRCPTPHTIT